MLTENSHKVQFSHSSWEMLHKFLLPCPSFAGTKRRFTRPQAAPLTVLAGINRHGQPEVLHSISITNITVSEDSLFNRDVPQMCHYNILEKNHNQSTNQPTKPHTKNPHDTTQPHIFRPAQWSNTPTSFPPVLSSPLQFFIREYEEFVFTFSLSNQPHARMKGRVLGAL